MIFPKLCLGILKTLSAGAIANRGQRFHDCLPHSFQQNCILAMGQTPKTAACVHRKYDTLTLVHKLLPIQIEMVAE